MKKDNLKKMPVIKQLIKIKKDMTIGKEFDYDKKFFKTNYVYSNPNTISKISYDLIRLTHSVEKGLASTNPRPFGIYATDTLINLIKDYERITKEPNFSYNMTLTVLEKYVSFYDEHGWNSVEQYKKVKEFINSRIDHPKIAAGETILKEEDMLLGTQFDFDKFLSSRHSVRNFSNKKVPESLIRECTQMAIKTPSACNRQMIKVYDARSQENISYITKVAQGVGGFEIDNISYLIITYDTNSLYFEGERNQGYFNAGLFSMNLVNAMHSKGIGSCFIQFGNSFKEEYTIKKKLNIPDSERISVFIAYGYYAKVSKIPLSTRKTVENIYAKL